MDSAQIFTLIVLAALYFLPTIVASCRRHHQSAAIFLVNLCFGWTIVGWLLALIWSHTAVNHDPSREADHAA